MCSGSSRIRISSSRGVRQEFSRKDFSVKQWSASVVLFLMACGGAAADREVATGPLEPVRTDSAGVQLLHHAAGALERAPRITLDNAPVAEIMGLRTTRPPTSRPSFRPSSCRMADWWAATGSAR
jgi:hypothetical protein